MTDEGDLPSEFRPSTDESYLGPHQLTRLTPE